MKKISRWIKELLAGRAGDGFAEAALVLPIVVLLTMGMMTLAIAAFASVNASNAANYGARVGSVTQRGAGGAAYAAAVQSVSYANVGKYDVSVAGGGFPGAHIVVSVNWSVQNFMAPIITIVGGGAGGGSDLSGTAEATFRQEGW